jgi:hypothetical protein
MRGRKGERERGEGGRERGQERKRGKVKKGEGRHGEGDEKGRERKEGKTKRMNANMQIQKQNYPALSCLLSICISCFLIV